MKITLVITAAVCLVLAASAPTHAQSIMDRIKAAKDKAAAAAAAKPATPAPADPAKPADPAAAPAPAATPAAGAAPADPTASAPANIAVYQNYDFTPGDTIVFADDFATTQDGEFPEQWELLSGQGVVNKLAGRSAFLLTEGNYGKVSPRVKTKTYLPAQYTIEYDTYVGPAGSYCPMVFLDKAGQESSYVHVTESEADYYSGLDGFVLNSNLPAAIAGDNNYRNRWHHIAIVVKNAQLKVYVDQYRVLSVPDMHGSGTSIMIGGIASQEGPLILSNVRVATGGGMNMIGQKFTDAKIVTHGINFDIDKATLRPESMGTLNQIKRVLTDNPDLKFEVDGHTDNTGTSAHNLTLSQQRADAVKAQLITMGIDASRLTTKGLGDTKPMTTNDTPEGKANNRRVEFVKVT